MSSTPDLEKYTLPTSTANAEPNSEDVGSSYELSRSRKGWEWLKQSSMFEYRGITPVPVADRTDTRYINLFSFWTSMTLSVLPFTFGFLGPLSYGLSLENTSLIVLFFSILCGIPVAYLCTLGPKTGMRQMSLARYSFGYYLVSIPILLNLVTLVGYCVIGDVIGGEILAAVNPDEVSSNVGIAIIGILALIISALGYKILHYYERVAWIIALICVVILIGAGGSNLYNQAEFPDPEASTVISFGSLMAGYYLPWACIASDFSTYMGPNSPSKRIFWYSYIGLIGPSILLLIAGAAIGGAVQNVPAWQDAYNSGSTGLIFAVVLEPLGGFGKFILVMLSLTIVGNLASTVYAVTLNFQALLPIFTYVPRVVYAIVMTAIMIPVSVKAAVSFYDNLENFVSVISYWAAAWTAVVLVEHFWFRKADAARYPPEFWHSPKALPPGVAAIAASALSFALVIPSMAQIWYVGPIGAQTGDIGFEVAFAVTALLYVPFRYLEIKVTRHL